VLVSLLLHQTEYFRHINHRLRARNVMSSTWIKKRPSTSVTPNVRNYLELAVMSSDRKKFRSKTAPKFQAETAGGKATSDFIHTEGLLTKQSCSGKPRSMKFTKLN
jgi:hypothetical protein